MFLLLILSRYFFYSFSGEVHAVHCNEHVCLSVCHSVSRPICSLVLVEPVSRKPHGQILPNFLRELLDPRKHEAWFTQSPYSSNYLCCVWCKLWDGWEDACIEMVSDAWVAVSLLGANHSPRVTFHVRLRQHAHGRLPRRPSSRRHGRHLDVGCRRHPLHAQDCRWTGQSTTRCRVSSLHGVHILIFVSVVCMSLVINVFMLAVV